MRNLRPFVALAIVVIATACDGGLTEATIERKFKVYTGTDKVFIQIDQQLGFASATGVWTVEGDDKIADPINISRIFCSKAEQYCEDNAAWVSNITGTPHLMARRDMYNVTSWSDTRVVAELTADCRSIQLQISTEDNSVTTITRNANGCTELEKPRLTRLISGKELDDQRR